MIDHLNEHKLLEVLLEVRNLADTDETITLQDLMKQIEAMLLQKTEINEKQLVLHR